MKGEGIANREQLGSPGKEGRRRRRRAGEQAGGSRWPAPERCRRVHLGRCRNGAADDGGSSLLRRRSSSSFFSFFPLSSVSSTLHSSSPYCQRPTCLFFPFYPHFQLPPIFFYDIGPWIYAWTIPVSPFLFHFHVCPPVFFFFLEIFSHALPSN